MHKERVHKTKYVQTIHACIRAPRLHLRFVSYLVYHRLTHTLTMSKKSVEKQNGYILVKRGMEVPPLQMGRPHSASEAGSLLKEALVPIPPVSVGYASSMLHLVLLSDYLKHFQ